MQVIQILNKFNKLLLKQFKNILNKSFVLIGEEK